MDGRKIGKFFGSLGSWVKYGGIWKKWGSMLGGGRGVEECMRLVWRVYREVC